MDCYTKRKDYDMKVYLGANTTTKDVTLSDLVDCLDCEIHEFKIMSIPSTEDLLALAQGYSARGYDVTVDTPFFYGNFAPYARARDYARIARNRLNTDAKYA